MAELKGCRELLRFLRICLVVEHSGSCRLFPRRSKVSAGEPFPGSLRGSLYLGLCRGAFLLSFFARLRKVSFPCFCGAAVAGSSKSRP